MILHSRYQYHKGLNDTKYEVNHDQVFILSAFTQQRIHAYFGVTTTTTFVTRSSRRSGEGGAVHDSAAATLLALSLLLRKAASVRRLLQVNTRANDGDRGQRTARRVSRRRMEQEASKVTNNERAAGGSACRMGARHVA